MLKKWVTTKLVPLFEKFYLDKKMILVADNAPYRHKRKIGLLASLPKNNLISLMIKHDVEYIDLPITSYARHDLFEMKIIQTTLMFGIEVKLYKLILLKSTNSEDIE